MKKLLALLFIFTPFFAFAAGWLNLSKNEACNIYPKNSGYDHYPYDGVSIKWFSTSTSHGFIKKNNVIYYLIEDYVNETQYSLYNYQCKDKKISKIAWPVDFIKIASKLWIGAHAWYIGDGYSIKDDLLNIRYQYTNFNPTAEDKWENIIDVSINLKTKWVSYKDRNNKTKTFILK